jgi:hypothetical protein
VKLDIVRGGEDRFSTGAIGRAATHFVVKVDIPGVTGALADVLGKTPPDSHVWVLPGDAPTFVKAEWPLSADGPVWRVEMVSPVWPSRTPPRDDGVGGDPADRQ